MHVELLPGDRMIVKLDSVGAARGDGLPSVVFEVHGKRWCMPVIDQSVLLDAIWYFS